VNMGTPLACLFEVAPRTGPCKPAPAAAMIYSRFLTISAAVFRQTSP
jgi:hypothetical protein